MPDAPLRILVLHGPNLDRLGTREPEVYGRRTLAEIDAALAALAAELGVALRCRQSNHEGVLIEALHEAADDCDGVLLNPAGYGHTSVALRDAVALAPPTVEVHLSNPLAREPFRQRSLVAPVCLGTVQGFGALGYEAALRALVGWLREGGGAA